MALSQQQSPQIVAWLEGFWVFILDRPSFLKKENFSPDKCWQTSQPVATIVKTL
jgi:hypothetical protein